MRKTNNNNQNTANTTNKQIISRNKLMALGIKPVKRKKIKRKKKANAVEAAKLQKCLEHAQGLY